MNNEILRKFLFIGALFLPQVSQLQQTTDWTQEKIKLGEMRQRWIDQEIHDYSFLLDASCFGCPWYFPARVLVKEDSVVAVLDPDTGEPSRQKTTDGTQGRLLWPEEAEKFQTIDGLFTVVERAITDRDGSLQSNTISSGFSVEYDETYGIPLTIFIDNTRTVGGGVRSDSRNTYRISDLSH
jgi:hypothetical protein